MATVAKCATLGLFDCVAAYGGRRSISQSISSSTTDADNVNEKGSAAFPIESRMRAKKEALGDNPKESVRRRFPAGDHFDDCGDDLSGLKMLVTFFSGLYEDFLRFEGDVQLLARYAVSSNGYWQRCCEGVAKPMSAFEVLASAS